MAQRTSVALFLASSALMVAAADQFPAPRHAQQLAQAADCVPIGEGENCARERVRKTTAPATAAPAGEASGSGAASKAVTGTPKVQD